MANLPESATYDAGVYQIETTDPVQGGVSGVTNSPLKNLTNRTAYLKQHIDAIEAGTFIPPGIAVLNSPAFTGDPTAPTAPLGDNDTSIATTAFVQGTLRGVLSKSVAGGVNVTLTAVEAGNGILIFTGTLTANIAVIVPSNGGRWQVVNSTSGAFSLTVKTAAGSGVTVAQGKSRILYCDATNVNYGDTDWTDLALTGNPTAPTAAVGDSDTSIATTAFVQAAISGLITVNVAGNTDVTLTQSQWGYGILKLTGALTGNINVIVPAQADEWIVQNNTTGSYSVTLKTASGTGALCAQGQSVLAYCDGTNVTLAGSAAQTSFTYSRTIATAGQTSFNAVYTPGNLIVFKNGGLLDQTDYTATDGAHVVLGSGANVNDEIVIYAFSSFTVSGAVSKSGDTMTGALTLAAGSTAPTPTAGDNSTLLATTAFVQAAAGGSAASLYNFEHFV
jgi:hypothetical protein